MPILSVFLKVNLVYPPPLPNSVCFIEYYYRNGNKKETFKLISNTDGFAGGSQSKTKSHEYSWHHHKYNGRCVITADK